MREREREREERDREKREEREIGRRERREREREDIVGEGIVSLFAWLVDIEIQKSDNII